MRNRFFLSGLFLTFVLLLCLVAVIPVAGSPSFQVNATDQQATVDTLVNERFTATAESVADIATNVPTAIPSITPIPTLTLMPTAIFENSFYSTGSNASSTVIVVDISQGAFEHYTEGWEQYWRDDSRDAQDEFDAAIDLEPEWAEAYFARGINHFADEDYDDALEDMDLAIEFYGQEDIAILSWRIFLYNEFNDYDAAIDDGELILAENPYDVAGLNNLAYAYLLDDQYQAAVDVIDLTLLYAANDLFNFQIRRDAHDGLGLRDDRRFDESMIDGINAYFDDDFDDAIEEFEEAVDRAEDTVRSGFNTAIANWNLALANFVDGNMDDGFDALDAAEDAFPEMGNIYYLRGLAQPNNADADDVLSNIDLGIDFAPDFPNNYAWRGLFYENNGDDDLATQDTWQYLQLRQSHVLLWQSIDPIGENLRLPFLSGWQHRFLVDGQTGDRLSVSAEESGIGGSDVDAIIVVLDPNGNPIISRDDEDTSTVNAAISDFNLASDGQYTIVIGAGISGERGMLDVEIDLD